MNRVINVLGMYIPLCLGNVTTDPFGSSDLFSSDPFSSAVVTPKATSQVMIMVISCMHMYTCMYSLVVPFSLHLTVVIVHLDQVTLFHK